MNAYTHAPRPLPNPLAAAWQQVAWLLFHPSAWRNRIAALEGEHPPTVSWAEPSYRQLTSGEWRRVALVGLMVVMLTTWVAVVIGLVVTGQIGVGVFSGLFFGLLSAVMMSFAVSIAAGLLAGIVATAAFTLFLGRDGTLLIDLMLSPAMGLIVGATVGAVGYAQNAVISSQIRQSLLQRVGGTVIGVGAGALGVLAIGVAPFLGILAWQSGLADIRGVALIMGLSPSLLFGLALGLRKRSRRRGLAYGAGLGLIVGGLLLSVFGGIAYNEHLYHIRLLLPFVVVMATSALTLFTLPYALAERAAGPAAGVIAGVLAVQIIHPIIGYVVEPYDWRLNMIAGAAISAVMLTLGWWRPLLFLPFQAARHAVLYRRDTQIQSGGRPQLYKHAAFWDEQQRARLAGLDAHLVYVLENYPQDGAAAVDFLAGGYQQWAALAAQIELDARHLERATTAATIAEASRYLGAGQLEGPASALLRSFSRISQDVAAALQQRSAYNQRLALRAVADRLDGLQRELTRSDETYAGRFRPIAVAWRRTIAGYIDKLEEAVARRQEIDNPYVIGVPLSAEQEVFVGRVDITRRIETLLLDRRRPPLLLYGQRRMGKTSLLNNLSRLLPNRILPVFIDLQGHVSYTNDLAGFFYNIARSMARSAEQQRGVVIPFFQRERFADEPLSAFEEWLDDLEDAARRAGSDTILLALDEFETLAEVLVAGGLSEAAVLGSLRHLIQHRPRFKVLLAGSHTLQEFHRWSGYFINAQIVHIGSLRDEEARRLIERPIKGFSLRYEPPAVRRVLELTTAHPFLVQLLCGELVALKNEQQPEVRQLATVGDVESAVPGALEVGSMFFADIRYNQVTESGANLLIWMAARGEGARVPGPEMRAYLPDEPTSRDTLELLIRRELIVELPDGYGFTVELIRRWFAQQVPVDGRRA